MKTITLITSAITVITILNCCSGNQQKNCEINIVSTVGLLDSNYQKKEFDSLLSVTCKRISSGLDYSEELLVDSAFMCIYEHSSAYLQDAIWLLLNENFTQMEANICIYGMQNLPLIDYIRFCKFYLILYNQNKISQGTLELTISPNFLRKLIIPENYAKPIVIEFLNNIRENKNISKEFKEMLENILSGKYIRGIESE